MTRRIAVPALVVSIGAALAVSCARQGEGSSSPQVRSRIIAIGDLSWPDVEALDRNRTMFLLTIGMLEEHGPHLPIASDTFGVEYEARGVAERMSQSLPDWNVVAMPTLHYGSSGANQIGNVAVHPGTYGIRQSTLRAVVADIGGQIAQNGFKWIFVMNGHGAPTHHVAVNYAVGTLSESREVARKPGWPGYFSAPARASADYGRDVEAWWVEGMSDLILQGVRGSNLLGRPRWPFPITNDPAYPGVEAAILQPEREFEVRLETWLRQREDKGANGRVR